MTFILFMNLLTSVSLISQIFPENVSIVDVIEINRLKAAFQVRAVENVSSVVLRLVSMHRVIYTLDLSRDKAGVSGDPTPRCTLQFLVFSLSQGARGCRFCNLINVDMKCVQGPPKQSTMHKQQHLAFTYHLEHCKHFHSESTIKLWHRAI